MCSSLSFAFLSFLCQMSIGHNHPPFGFQHGCSLLYACWAVLLANVQTSSHVSVKSKKHFFQLKVRIEKNNPAMISNFPLYRPTALHTLTIRPICVYTTFGSQLFGPHSRPTLTPFLYTEVISPQFSPNSVDGTPFKPLS